MSTLSLIQVGDIHYPDWNSKPFATDDKDARLSPVIKSGVTTVAIRRVLQQLSKKAADASTSAVVFMGDFTSRGDPKGLRSALHHFSWLCKADRYYPDQEVTFGGRYFIYEMVDLRSERLPACDVW